MAETRKGKKSAQGMMEYALILVLVAVVVIIALNFFGSTISRVFSNVVCAVPGTGCAAVSSPSPSPSPSPTPSEPVVTVNCGAGVTITYLPAGWTIFIHPGSGQVLAANGFYAFAPGSYGYTTRNQFSENVRDGGFTVGACPAP